MRNSNPTLSLLACLLVLQGCKESPGYFYDQVQLDPATQHVQYHQEHQLKLDIIELTTTVDESGFSPKLKGIVRLENAKKGPWPQAWVAMHIDILLNNEPLSELTRADVIENHHIEIAFEQELPRFGIATKQLKVQVRPIAWMPTYPLLISPSP